MILRIIITLVIIAVIVGGYFYIDDRLEKKRVEEYRRYAGVIAETSVAAELYRNKKDSFLVVRDSILNKYSLTQQQLLDFRDRYQGDERRWAEFWDYVVEISDSLIAYQESLLKTPPDNDSGAASK